jgi:hypothetical protein
MIVDHVFSLIFDICKHRDFDHVNFPYKNKRILTVATTVFLNGYTPNMAIVSKNLSNSQGEPFTRGIASGGEGLTFADFVWGISTFHVFQRSWKTQQVWMSLAKSANVATCNPSTADRT